MAIIDFDPKTIAELNAMRETMRIIEDLGATARAAELNAKSRKEGSGLNNAQVLKHLADGNDRSKKKVKRDFISMGSEDAERIAQEYVDKAAPAIARRATAQANMMGGNPGMSVEEAAKNVANKIAVDALYAAMEEVKRIISERIEKGVDYTGAQVEDLTEEYKVQKQRDHKHVYPIGNATGQVIDNLAPGKRNVRIKRK